MICRLDQIYKFRTEIDASMAFTWTGEDLASAIRHTLVIGSAPSMTKDALSLGLLSGELQPDGQALTGDLKLTDDGRGLVERFRTQMADVYP